MKIFLSHIYEERNLADAFKNLIEKLSEGQIKAWYSSDPRPSGGMELGDWRKQIKKEMEKSKAIIAIITPESNGVTWVAWESGFALGRNMEPIPLAYFLQIEKLHSVYGDQTGFDGDDLTSVSKLCAKLLEISDGRAIREAEMKSWGTDIEDYLKIIRKEERLTFTRSLFHDHFHNAERAGQIENKKWYAVWTQVNEDGTEEVFETDTLSCWTTDTRLRMVGEGAKGKPYPMEGVVSANGHVALSYWSEGNTPICGTVLMEPADLDGKVMSGTWSGYTEKSLKAKNLRYYSGRVVMALDKKVAENWKFDEDK